MANTVPREELLNCVLDIMEDNKRSHGNLCSVPRISFLDEDSSTSFEVDRVVYSVSMPLLDDVVDVDTATEFVVKAKHEGRHSEQIVDFFNDGQHDLMLIDWLSDQTGDIFYNFNEHEDLHEWDAYHEGLLQARPILASWFGKNVADDALLRFYMGIVNKTDTVYFTDKRRSDYTNLDKYISDMETFGESLYHKRTRIDVSKMYGGNSFVKNHGGKKVKDFPLDWYQEELQSFLKTDKGLLRQFFRSKDAFEQRKIVAGFMSAINSTYGTFIPGINKVDWTVQVKRNPFVSCGVDAADIDNIRLSRRVRSFVMKFDLDSDTRMNMHLEGFGSVSKPEKIEVVDKFGDLSVRDISEIKYSEFWDEMRSLDEQSELL